jgi:hypothetical protein
VLDSLRRMGQGLLQRAQEKGSVDSIQLSLLIDNRYCITSAIVSVYQFRSDVKDSSSSPQFHCHSLGAQVMARV